MKLRHPRVPFACPERTAERVAAFDALAAVPIVHAGTVVLAGGQELPVVTSACAHAIVQAVSRLAQVDGGPCRSDPDGRCATCSAGILHVHALRHRQRLPREVERALGDAQAPTWPENYLRWVALWQGRLSTSGG